MTLPTVALSVLTPSYNDAAFLPDCVQSVFTAAERAGLAVQHIVVDDGSTDDTEAVLTELERTHGIVRQRFPANRGASAALNAAARLALAPWLLILAADDMVTPGAFAVWQRIATDDCNLVYSDLEMFGRETGRYVAPDFDRERLRRRNTIPGCSFLTADLWAAVGGFDESMRTAQDWDFWVRADLVIALRPRKVKTPLVRYRRHHTPRLHNETVANIEAIRAIVQGRTLATAVLAA